MEYLITFETEENHFYLMNTGLLGSDVDLDLGRWFIEDCIAEAIEEMAKESIDEQLVSNQSNTLQQPPAKSGSREPGESE